MGEVTGAGQDARLGVGQELGCLARIPHGRGGVLLPDEQPHRRADRREPRPHVPVVEVRTDGPDEALCSDRLEPARELSGRARRGAEGGPEPREGELGGEGGDRQRAGLEGAPSTAACWCLPPLTATGTWRAASRAAARSRRRVAQALGIGAETVKTHLRTVYERLGVANRAELVAALRD